ncbi:Asp/Glu racemase [Corchorus olitorius]|uniref:Asp/Glu racemase n=1 Tax=Corchorus olitorius TaxID=93759 RepID=A0A1R3KQ33_9ROSI|nr:Asp/Glu racemase [Corchorus olitorius]
MTMSFHATVNCLPIPGILSKPRSQFRTRPNPNPSLSVQMSSAFLQTDESKNPSESKKISGSSSGLFKCQAQNSLLSQANTVGIIGGVSVFSTLIFLEKLVWWSSRNGEEGVPFVVCNDPALDEGFIISQASFQSSVCEISQKEVNYEPIIQNLKHKRVFLEQSGARCLVMPCHVSNIWHDEISEGCSLPFLHVGECVARELKEAKLKPLDAGSSVRIGVLAACETIAAGFYQEKLQNQGFEVVLPDKATMEHILIPALESLNKRDIEGARNLLRVAIQVLLIRGVNVVILASDELHNLLPREDPLLKKCIDPMDALARSTIRWAKSAKKVHKKT